MSTESAHVVRQAAPADLPALVDYEIEIARVSFGDEAVVEGERHAARLTKALDRDPDGCLVAVDAAGGVVGWLWMTINENFLTKEPYATFRSLAVSPSAVSSDVARLLIDRGLGYARDHDVTEVTGKVHAANVGMRMLYREFDFEPQHLTMRLKTGPADGGA
ncbi:MAG: GNAT family N-acetyltransferase [Nocardioides sp.]